MQRTSDHRANRDWFPGARPFSSARKSLALEEEDRFMELHGGRGGRIIYGAVCLMETAPVTAIRFGRGVFKWPPVRALIAYVRRCPVKSGQQRADNRDARPMLRLGTE